MAMNVQLDITKYVLLLYFVSTIVDLTGAN